MKNIKSILKAEQIICCLFFMSFFIQTMASEKHQISVGKWIIEYDKSTKTSKFIQDNNVILSGISVKTKVDGNLLNSTEYSNVSFSNSSETDEIGNLQKHIIEYSMDNKPTIKQIFYMYPEKDFFLTQIVLESSTGTKIGSNYIAPIYTTDANIFLPASNNNRMLTIPYDNDGFITYGSFPLTSDTLSFEVTSIFNGDSQNGLVIGSVEHNTWKTGVRMSASDNQYLNTLECFNGLTHHATRDNAPVGNVDYIMPHGTIKNNEIKSSRMMVGYFNDWRTGLETFGEINNAITPKRNWTNGVPFGWSSWGSIKENINYTTAISVSDFIKNNLQNNNFENDNTVYISLDSYWDNLNDAQLKAFADHCYANGQVPGVYWNPFRAWWNFTGTIEGSVYKYSEAITIANGTAKSLMGGSRCMDPTHPGTRDRMRYFVKKFKAAGFKYIKLDFLTDGAVEADFFYNKDITTGTQAYNYGMKLFSDLCGEDIFLVQSISPIFPANYSHARRIACDAWGEMWHTQYTMNSLSFGWWLDKVYVYNDADHLVMGNHSEGENRARMTSGAITGLYMLGDNLSTEGNNIGTPASQEKTKKFATNQYINEMARIGRSFRPAYGHISSSESGATDLFYNETDNYYYVVFFNYGSSAKTGYLNLYSLGINPDNISGGRECWLKIAVTTPSDGKLQYAIPGGDARVYQLFKKNPSSIQSESVDNKSILSAGYNYTSNCIEIQCSESLKDLTLNSIQGFVLTKKILNENKYSIPASHLPKGIYIVSANLENGQHATCKLIK